MTRKIKKRMQRILIGAACFADRSVFAARQKGYHVFPVDSGDLCLCSGQFRPFA